METTMSLVLRMVIAALLGIAVGAEREYRAKEAGIRTHFLVSLGSALFMIVSEYAFAGLGIRYDPSRIAAQVVSGIGFIGAGTIIIQKHNVRGLTTAAGLWATAGLGMAIGAGMYAVGVTAAVLILIAFEFLNWFVKEIGGRKRTVKFLTRDREILKKMTETGIFEKGRCSSYSMEPDENGNYTVTFTISAKGRKDSERLLRFLENFPEATIIHME